MALTAYARLGFGVHHGYLYLAPPDSEFQNLVEPGLDQV